jgi:anti-anti-sigma factor
MSLEALVLKTCDDAPVGVLALYGEVNSETVSKMDAHVAALMREFGKVVVDFTHTVYVSSAGWRGLMDESSKKGPARLAVAGMQPSVRDVYDLLGMAYLITAYDTVREAVVSVAGPVANVPAPRNAKTGITSAP